MSIIEKKMLANFKLQLGDIPPEYRRYWQLGLTLALFMALPLTVWGLTSASFSLTGRAAVTNVTAGQVSCEVFRGQCLSTEDCNNRLGTNLSQPECAQSQTACCKFYALPTPATCQAQGGQCLPKKQCAGQKAKNLGQFDCATPAICCQSSG